MTTSRIVSYKGQSYKVRGAKTAVPDLDAMDGFGARVWLLKNTYARGHSTKTNPLAGMGSVLTVRT